MVNNARSLVAGVGLSALTASVVVAEESQREIVRILKPNGAYDTGIVVPADQCGDGGGTTYTSEGRLVMRDPITGEIKNCDAFTIEERRIMAEEQKDDERNEPTPDPVEEPVTPTPDPVEEPTGPVDVL